MDHSPFGKTIAIILVVVLIFLFPLPYIAKAVNKTVDDLINTNMTEFTDAVRQKGTISKELYENMIRELDRTGELYDIDIEVSHPVSGAEIKETKLGDDIPDLKTENTSYIREKLAEDNFNEEEQHEGHSHGDEIRSFAVHAHTDACFAGHRHNSECYEPFRTTLSYYGLDTMHQVKLGGLSNDLALYDKYAPRHYATLGYRYSTGGLSYSAIAFAQYYWPTDGNTLRINQVTIYSIDQTATYPGTDPSWNRYITDGGNTIYWRRNPNYQYYDDLIRSISYGQYTDSQEQMIRKWMKFGYIPDAITDSNVRAYLKSVTYGQPYYFCKAAQDETPICNQVVTSITPTNPNQTVNKGSNIVTAANATYLDGHTAIINCTSNFNPNQLGAQTVTLTYYGLVDNVRTTGTKTCTVNVTVKDPFKLSSLTVSPSSQEVFRYQSPSFSVTANYDNGTSKPVTGYSVSDYNSSVIGIQTITVSYSESAITKSATVNVIVRNLTRVCPICYTGYYLDNDDKDPGCPYCKSTIVSISASPDSIVLNKGKPLNITVEATYRNGSRSIVTEWTSNYDSSQVGIQDVTITYQTFTASIQVEVRNQLKTCSICSQEYELNNDGTDPGCPVCKKTVVGIDATPKVLTINKHQSLPIAVKATYKDGHTENINDWASNLMADTAGIYEVMILYQNVMDNITVTVIEDGQIECPYCGLKYLFNDSPKGCPSCYVTLTGIEASLRNGGTKVPHKSKLNLQITKIFMDKHREITYTGWTVSDYNPGQLGNQTITAHYNGFSNQLDIEVVDDLPEVTCPNGHTYYLNADGSDPGCPYCSGTVDKEESLFYYDTTYTSFIMDAIYTNGEFPLKKGDYLKITIRPRNLSILSKLLKMFTGVLKREYTLGGEVS